MIMITFSRRYKIQEEIGKGGRGTLCQASDKVLQRDVALKVLSASLISI